MKRTTFIETISLLTKGVKSKEPTSLIKEEIPVQEYVAESSDSLIDENEWLNAAPIESSDKIQHNNNFYEETTSSNNNV